MGEHYDCWGGDAAAVPVPDAGDDTLREHLIGTAAEHRLTTPVQCVCGWRETDHPGSAWDVHLADALLPLIRDHTAGLALGMQSWRERAEEAEAEAQRLTDWKESAMTVMSGLQDLGKELELPLGESITGTLAAETAHQLRTRAEKAEAAIQRVRELVTALREEAPRNAELGLHIRCGVKRGTAKRIEDALDREATDG